MTSVTLSSKFQLSIPKAIRDEMQLQPGQKFAIIPKGGHHRTGAHPSADCDAGHSERC